MCKGSNQGRQSVVLSRDPSPSAVFIVLDVVFQTFYVIPGAVNVASTIHNPTDPYVAFGTAPRDTVCDPECCQQILHVHNPTSPHVKKTRVMVTHVKMNDTHRPLGHTGAPSHLYPGQNPYPQTLLVNSSIPPSTEVLHNDISNYPI
jgi:hypothetical protein